MSKMQINYPQFKGTGEHIFMKTMHKLQQTMMNDENKLFMLFSIIK